MEHLEVAAFAVMALAGVLAPSVAASQDWVEESVCADNTPAAFHACALAAADSFDPPRTPDGRPHLGGYRMLPGGQFGGAYEDLEEHPGELDALGGAAVIVDPPDGVLPIRRWAAEQSEVNAVQFLHHNAACFLAGVPNTMYHGGPRQFLQTPDYLVILSYNAHAYRIVRLDDRPPLGEKIRLWNGDSRGWWDGDTLVVDVVHFTGQTWFDRSGNFHGEALHVIERYTRAGPDHMIYEATIEDPEVFTESWQMRMPLYRRQEENMRLLEYECHAYLEAGRE